MTASSTNRSIAFTFTLALVIWLTAGCARTTTPQVEAGVTPQPASQPTLELAQTPEADEAAIVLAQPAGPVIDTSKLPDTLYGESEAEYKPQFYDATAPVSRKALVIADEATLHLRPERQSEAVAQVSKSDQLMLTERARRGAWFHVSTSKGTSGWIHGNTIRLVEHVASSTAEVKPPTKRDSKSEDEGASTSTSSGEEPSEGKEESVKDATNTTVGKAQATPTRRTNAPSSTKPLGTPKSSAVPGRNHPSSVKTKPLN